MPPQISRFSPFYFIVAAIVSIFFFVGLHSYDTREEIHHVLPQLPERKRHVEFPRKIWQFWQGYDQQTANLSAEYHGWSAGWRTTNPQFRYELLGSDSANTYVQEHFQDRDDIQQTFARLADPILRADVIRYLILYAEGGVYTDMDTQCSRPIRDWLNPYLSYQANLVLGIEYDARDDEVRSDMGQPAQICQWTVMAKPGHQVLERVINRTLGQLLELGGEDEAIVAHTVTDVLGTTGPRQFTAAVLEALTIQTGRPVTMQDLGYIDSPKLIGDVLILPVSAFASGQMHSASKPLGNEEQLVSHAFRGEDGWRKHHHKGE